MDSKRNLKIVSLIIVCFLTGVLTGFLSYHYLFKTEIGQAKLEPTKEMIEKLIFYDKGEQQIIDPESQEGRNITGLLTRKLHEVNLQSAACLYDERRIEEMRQKDRIIEMIFKKPIDIGVSFWVEPEERYHATVDAKGYLIFEDVKNVIFVLEGSRYADRGEILISYNLEEGVRYGCWAIRVEEGSPEIDKSWVDRVEREHWIK